MLHRTPEGLCAYCDRPTRRHAPTCCQDASHIYWSGAVAYGAMWLALVWAIVLALAVCHKT